MTKDIIKKATFGSCDVSIIRKKRDDVSRVSKKTSRERKEKK